MRGRCIKCGAPDAWDTRDNPLCPMCTDESARAELKTLEDRVYRAVCDIYGVVCKEDAERLEELRRRVGMRWDAACRVWRPLD